MDETVGLRLNPISQDSLDTLAMERILPSLLDAPVEVPVLIASLRDKETEVQLFATQSVRQFREWQSEFLPVMIANLKDPAPRVRQATAETLGHCERTAIPALRQAMSDADAHVSSAAETALLRIDPGALSRTNSP